MIKGLSKNIKRNKSRFLKHSWRPFFIFNCCQVDSRPEGLKLSWETLEDDSYRSQLRCATNPEMIVKYIRVLEDSRLKLREIAKAREYHLNGYITF